MEFLRTRLTTNNSHIILHRRLPQTQILPNQHTYPNPRNIKPIQKGMRRLHQLKLHRIPTSRQIRTRRRLGPVIAPIVVTPQQHPPSYRGTQFKRPPRHLYQDTPVPLVNIFENGGKFGLPCELPLARGRMFGHGEYFEEGGGVEFLDLLYGFHVS
eukprot:CCRYP_014048-RF/>CCRYP_014048-RF protein AED:0.47 eAED:0.47 QI:0/0/0/1/0/0/2/0/155